MNILYYCSEYPPYTTGGIGRVTQIVAEELVSRGHNVHVIGYYSKLSDEFEYSEINGVKIFRHNAKSVINDCPRLFQLIRKLGLAHNLAQKNVNYIENLIQEHITKYNIDVFEMTDFYPFSLYSPNLYFRKFTVPTILRIHGSASYVQAMSGNGRSYYFDNDSRHFDRCNCMLAVSEFSLKYVLDNYNLPKRKQARVVYNPIDDNYLFQSKSQSDNIVLFIGKLIETKGCVSLARAFNNIAAECPDISLMFVGSGDQNEVLKFIDDVYRHRVKFCGYCDRDTLTTMIDKCSFACIPSYFESFSMVALEVMARGKALIFTDRTSGKEIVTDGYNGYTVDPDDIREISLRIKLLATDHELRDTLAANALHTVRQKYKASKIVQDIERIYKNILLES